MGRNNRPYWWLILSFSLINCCLHVRRRFQKIVFWIWSWNTPVVPNITCLLQQVLPYQIIWFRNSIISDRTSSTWRLADNRRSFVAASDTASLSATSWVWMKSVRYLFYVRLFLTLIDFILNLLNFSNISLLYVLWVLDIPFQGLYFLTLLEDDLFRGSQFSFISLKHSESMWFDFGRVSEVVFEKR